MITVGIVKKIKSLVVNGQNAINGTFASGERVTVSDTFKNYGFRSSAPAESKGIALFFGGQSDQGVLIKTHLDTEEIAEGDCELYNMGGSSVKLEGENLIGKSAGNLRLSAKQKIKFGTESVDIFRAVRKFSRGDKFFSHGNKYSNTGPNGTGASNYNIKSKRGYDKSPRDKNLAW